MRQVAETGPYFRDGQAATLDDVIEFYDRGGDRPGTYIGGPKEIQRLYLSRDEKGQLRAFLKTLTGLLCRLFICKTCAILSGGGRCGQFSAPYRRHHWDRYAGQHRQDGGRLIRNMKWWLIPLVISSLRR